MKMYLLHTREFATPIGRDQAINLISLECHVFQDCTVRHRHGTVKHNKATGKMVQVLVKASIACPERPCTVAWLKSSQIVILLDLSLAVSPLITQEGSSY